GTHVCLALDFSQLRRVHFCLLHRIDLPNADEQTVFAGEAMNYSNWWYLIAFAWGMVCAWAVVVGLEVSQ
ncbi:hypothetical protein, partial [Herbaspirillum huttiense]